MSESAVRIWPIVVHDKAGRRIYLTEERWQHALDHPGMQEGLLEAVLETVNLGRRKQDSCDPAQYKYVCTHPNLPGSYTHVVVIVKFGVTHGEPIRENNFLDGLPRRKVDRRVDV